MPTMVERVAVIEADQKTVKDDVAEIKSDVKLLVAWQNQERGARRQRAVFFSVASVAVPLVVSVILRVVIG